MPAHFSTVVFIGQNRLKAVKLPSHLSSQRVFESSWEARSLSRVLSQLKEELNIHTLHLILGDNLSFLSPIFLDSDKSNLEAAVLEQAKNILPEPLEKLGVDWKQVYQTDEYRAIQIFAAQKKLLSLLGRASQAASLKIASIEPAAYALARVVPHQSQPHLVLWEDNFVEAVIVVNGQVLASTQMADLDIYNQIESLLSFVEEKYNFAVAKIVVPKRTKKINRRVLESKTTIPTEEKEVDLFRAASVKSDVIGEDEDVLNITPKEVFADESDDQSFEDEELEDDHQPVTQTVVVEPEEEGEEKATTVSVAPTPPKKEVSPEDQGQSNQRSADGSAPQPMVSVKWVVFFFVVLIIITGVLVGGVVVYRNAVGNKPASPLQEPSSEATPTPEPTPSPTPEIEIDRSQVKIQIQNGSGIKGLASKVVSILENLGYQDIKAGNADNFDYQETSLSVKSDQQALIDLVKQDLASDYSIEISDQDLDQDSDYDAVIILGQSADTQDSSPDDTDTEDSE